jgi:hypothetical protein
MERAFAAFQRFCENEQRFHWVASRLINLSGESAEPLIESAA